MLSNTSQYSVGTRKVISLSNAFLMDLKLDNTTLFTFFVASTVSQCSTIVIEVQFINMLKKKRCIFKKVMFLPSYYFLSGK